MHLHIICMLSGTEVDMDKVHKPVQPKNQHNIVILYRQKERPYVKIMTTVRLFNPRLKTCLQKAKMSKWKEVSHKW